MKTARYLFRDTTADAIISFLAAHVPEAIEVECAPVVSDMLPGFAQHTFVRATVTLDPSQFRSELTLSNFGRAEAVIPSTLEKLLQKRFSATLEAR